MTPSSLSSSQCDNRNFILVPCDYDVTRNSEEKVFIGVVIPYTHPVNGEDKDNDHDYRLDDDNYDYGRHDRSIDRCSEASWNQHTQMMTNSIRMTWIILGWVLLMRGSYYICFYDAL